MEQFEIHPIEWTTESESAREIRQKVFVEEQQVPVELEWDEDDMVATHFVAWHNNKAVATARILDDGHIGRMAVLREWRGQGLGKAMLAQCEEWAYQQGLKEVFLHAQISAIDFYKPQGYRIISDEFMDAGIPHRTMKKTFPETAAFDSENPYPGQRFSIGEESGKISLESKVDFQNAALDLALKARRTICILSFDLEHVLYDHDDTIRAFSRMVRHNRANEIRVLVTDSYRAVKFGHRLVELARRLPSYIHLRRTHSDYADHNENFMVVDDMAILYRPSYELYTGFVDYKGIPIAQQKQLWFNEIWERSSEDPSFRQLSL